MTGKTTLARIDELEKTVSELKTTVGSALELAEMAATKAMALEQAMASIGKILTATCSVLADRGLISNEDVMRKMRDAESKSEENEVKNLIDSGILIPADIISDLSLVVVSQNLINLVDGDQSKVLSDFRVIKMADPFQPNQLKQDLTDKKVGDILEVNKQDDMIMTLQIKEVYNFVEQKQAV